MSWITENPWPLMMLLIGAGLVLLFVGEKLAKRVGVVLLVLSVGLYFVEQQIVTSGERLENTLQVMLERFRNRDQAGIDALIAKDAQTLRDTARAGLEQVELHEGFHLKDVEVVVSDDGQTAAVELRGNGTLTVRQTSSIHLAATRWRTQWRNDSGDWKLAQVQRLNPLTGEEIGVLAAQ